MKSSSTSVHATSVARTLERGDTGLDRAQSLSRTIVLLIGLGFVVLLILQTLEANNAPLAAHGLGTERRREEGRGWEGSGVKTLFGFVFRSVLSIVR